MNYSTRNANLLNRFDRHASHPSAAELRGAAERCLAIAQNFSDHRDELQRAGFYTAEGRKAKLSEALTKQVARQMREARAPIDAAAKGVERLRGQIKPAAVDQSPVAEMRRAEIRAYVRNLPAPARMAALLDKPDPKVVEAVLDAPAFLSGVLDDHYASAKAAREEQLYGSQFRAIEALQAVVEDADVAATIARTDLASVAEMDKAAFDNLVPIRESLA